MQRKTLYADIGNSYKENLALAMLALSQGLTVTIYYNTTCNSNGDEAFVSLVVG